MPEVWEGWYCVCVMVVMFMMLLKNIAGPDILMLGALAMMLAAGTVSIKEGLSGFSNKGVRHPQTQSSNPTSSAPARSLDCVAGSLSPRD